MTEQRENWGSRIGFILSAAGFSIGLGNIWRFPYLVGTYGGGAFLLVYVLICVLIGVPLFIAEVGLGRKTMLTPIVGMKKLAGGKSTPWSLIGWVGCLACIVLMSYYMVIIGWMFAYAVKSVSGTFNGIDPEGTKAIFQEFMNSPVEMAGYTLFVIAVLGLTVTQGLKNGVERACKWMLPILGIMLVVLAARSLTMTPQVEGGKTALDGLKWYLTPDFSKITGQAILAALGQSFFSIGIGISTAIVYGSYLKPDSNIPVDSCWVVSMDTGFAVIAGIVIFPALFCYGMDPTSGFGLVFEALPALCQLSFTLSAAMSSAARLREMPNPAATMESRRREATVARISFVRSSRGAISSKFESAALAPTAPIIVRLLTMKSAIFASQMIFAVSGAGRMSPISSRSMPSPMTAPSTSRCVSRANCPFHDASTQAIAKPSGVPRKS